ncbi:MAG: T9SS type A sorting domain-containing protein [Saprospiraceae bacterium]
MYNKIKPVLNVNKVSLTFLILCFLYFPCNSQNKFDYNWVLGYGRSEPSETYLFGGFTINFNSSITFKNQTREFNFEYNTNSYSNNLGELELMSNGCLIADGNSSILKNGDGINFGTQRNTCPLLDIDLQAGLFISFKSNDSIIYYIHTITDTIGKRLHRKYILLTSINKNIDSIVRKNEILIKDTLLLLGFTAIRSSDKDYWWLLHPRIYSNSYVALKLKYDGTVSSILKNQIGIYIDTSMSGEAQSSFSPNGKKFGIFFPNKGLQVMDFDRSTGLMSNSRFFNLNYNRAVFGGCAFSPNSRFVYVNTNTELMQVDLEETDSIKAVDTIGLFDNFFDPYPTTFLQMILGPDCRIYMSTYGGNRYLHVILYPDIKGKKCKFVQRGLKLPARNSFALPNNPHYRVDEPWPCDSTITIPLNTSVTDPEEGVFRKGDLLIYPQPASEFIIIQAIGIDESPNNIQISNLQGELIMNKNILFYNQELKLDISTLQAGIYFIKLSNKDRIWTGRVMIGS